MATLVRWEPFRVAQLQGEMSRLFNGLLEGQGRNVSGMDAAAGRRGD